MPDDAAIDPLYARVGELLTECGATVGEPGSMMRACSPNPSESLRALEKRLGGAGLRPRDVPTCRVDEVQFTVLDPIDRVVSITIYLDPLRRAGARTTS
ncbi:hypothetical protein AB0F43_31340 [Kribbella sp. NPDC023972]|uniref:hypothetical protein n=1 Tax=Kribbella sp. NPDC023972 TaxID=3154795 RepID=UPI0033FF9D0B